MSALAKFFLAAGNEVSGSDAADSETTEELRKLGVKIFIGHKAENLTQPERVIFSAAVREDNPELVEARRLNVKTQKYAEALGEITREKFTIAISGMHGKSTTTAMIGLMMEKAGLDPTVIVGTKVREWGNSNFRLGQSQYLVIEADEYDRSFLNYWPKILVLLNIEEEHLDTYVGGLPDIMKTFGEYVSHLGEDGVLVANGEDANILKIPGLAPARPRAGKNPRPRQVHPAYTGGTRRGGQKSKLQCKVQNYNSKLKIDGLCLKVSGKHNLSNAAAAITAARILGIADKIAVKTLNNFTGTWRRMEFRGEVNGAKIYDDYGHHPTEIKATLEGARELLSFPTLKRGIKGDLNPSQPPFKKGGDHKLYCVFQPHQYQRTYKLFNQFIGSFADADKVILLPIYSVAGREKNEIKKKVSSEMLAEAIKMQNAKCKVQNDPAQIASQLYGAGNAKCKIIKSQDVIYLDSFEKAANYLKKNLKAGDVCVIMGAGDIYKLTERLICKNPRPRQACPA